MYVLGGSVCPGGRISLDLRPAARVGDALDRVRSLTNVRGRGELTLVGQDGKELEPGASLMDETVPKSGLACIVDVKVGTV